MALIKQRRDFRSEQDKEFQERKRMRNVRRFSLDAMPSLTCPATPGFSMGLGMVRGKM